MTLMEKLKQLFGSKLDEEVDETEQTTVVEKQEEVKTSEETKDNKQEQTKTEDKTKNNEVNTDKNISNEEVKEEQTVAIFGEGWYDPATNKVDISKITNEEAANAIKTLTSAYEAEKTARLIDEGINTELGNYSLNISKDMLMKLLDRTNIKLDKDGKVTGAKEAIEAIKTSEPGFFKNKDKESNPLNEGFNPVEKRNSDNITSFGQAFRLMEEIS